MNIEQERADFEAWAEKRGVWPRLTHQEIFSAGYQAGRAAIQSNDPYRELQANQADLIDMDRLRKWLTAYGIATPSSMEEFAATFGKQVNALTRSEPFPKCAALQSQKPEPNDVMLSGVLRMPFDMAMATEISRIQFYSRAQQALNELEALQSQDLEDAERPVLDSIVDEIHRRADKEWADDGYDFEVTITADEYKALCEEEKAIDHARKEQP